MKKTLSLLSLLALTGSLSIGAEAEAKKPAFLVAPVGVIAYKDVTGKPEYGAGLNLGYQLNNSVSLNATALGFERPDHWRGSAIDELDLTAKFDLFHANKLTLYGVAGGSREWNRDDWGVDIGGGVRVDLHRNVSLFGQYVFQVWVEESSAAQVQAGVSFNF